MTVRGRDGQSLVFNCMALLSLLLHVLFLSFFFLSSSLPEKKWTFGPVYSVELVSNPVKLEDGKKTAPMSKELSAPLPKHHPMVFAKSDESHPTPLVKPLTSLQKREKSESAEAAIDELRKKVYAHAQPVSNPATHQTAAGPLPKGGGSAEMDAKWRAYYARIWGLIKKQWALPGGIMPDHDTQAVIVIVILRDGTLENLNIEKSSGNKYFDQSATRAIKKASPFPPLSRFVQGEHNRYRTQI